MFSGPMMKLVYKLQAEDYKFDFPVTYLPVSKLWGERHAWDRVPCTAAAVVGAGQCLGGCGLVGRRMPWCLLRAQEASFPALPMEKAPRELVGSWLSGRQGYVTSCSIFLSLQSFRAKLRSDLLGGYGRQRRGGTRISGLGLETHSCCPCCLRVFLRIV